VLVVRQRCIDVDTARRHDVVAVNMGPGLGWRPKVVQFRIAGCRDEGAGPAEDETCEVSVRRIERFETGSEYLAWAASVVTINIDVMRECVCRLTFRYAC